MKADNLSMPPPPIQPNQLNAAMNLQNSTSFGIPPKSPFTNIPQDISSSKMSTSGLFEAPSPPPPRMFGAPPPLPSKMPGGSQLPPPRRFEESNTLDKQQNNEINSMNEQKSAMMPMSPLAKNEESEVLDNIKNEMMHSSEFKTSSVSQ